MSSDEATRPSEHDRLRCAALHAHADMQVALKLLRRLRLVAAWQRFQRGYIRLEKALDWRDAHG